VAQYLRLYSCSFQTTVHCLGNLVFEFFDCLLIPTHFWSYLGVSKSFLTWIETFLFQ